MPRIELTQAELIPFRAGRRLAYARPELLSAPMMALAELSPHLIPAERRALLDVDDGYFLEWVAIGMDFTRLELLVKRARSG